MIHCSFSFFFFFNDTATTEIYTLSLHDALPISRTLSRPTDFGNAWTAGAFNSTTNRSEEHTSELQSHVNLVCRLLLEKKKNLNSNPTHLDNVDSQVFFASNDNVFGNEL